MSLAVNILTTLSARVVVLVLALASSIVLARALGPEGRGVFVLIQLLPELVVTLGLLGVAEANAVYAGLLPERRVALVWQSVVLAGLTGTVALVAGTAYLALDAPGADVLVRGPLWLYLLALATVPARILIEHWTAILRGMNRIYLTNILDVASRVTALFLILVLVGWIRLDVAGAVWSDSVVIVATALLLAMFLRHVDALGRTRFDRSLWRRTWSYALPAHFGTVMNYLSSRADHFILAALLLPEQLGFYAIAVGIAERLSIPTGAVASALLPHLTNSRDRDPALAAVIARHVALWTTAACLAVFVLAEVLVTTLYSSEFVGAVAPLRWFALGIPLVTLGRVVGAEILAREAIRYVVWVAGVTTVVNIAANLVLIPRMGVSGAAQAWCISYAMRSLAVTAYYLHQTRVRWTVLLPRCSDFLAYVALWHRLAALARRPGTITSGSRL